MSAPWWTGYPDAGPVGIVAFPVIQAIQGMLWSEDMKPAKGKAVTVTLGKRPVEGAKVDGIIGGLIAVRQRWVGSERSNLAPLPWGPYPGAGYRSHVQCLIRGDSGTIAMAGAYGKSAKTLTDGVREVEYRTADAAKMSAMSIHPCVWNIRLEAGPEESAGEDGTFTPWALTLAANATAEVYTARLADVRRLQWWADAWL